MGEIGKIISTDDSSVEILFTRSEACAKCRACTAGMRNDEMRIRAKNACGAEVGDWVELELRDGYFLKAIVIMYGLPLVMLILGGAGGFYLIESLEIADSEIYGFFIGIILMILSYLVIAKIDKCGRFKTMPVAVRKVLPPVE